MRTRDEGKATAGKGPAPFCDLKNKVELSMRRKNSQLISGDIFLKLIPFIYLFF